MQLMPDTAEWIAHKYNEDGAGYSFDSLYDPETNIRYGTWYLGYLSRRFDGDATKIVCAYHAGQGNVDSWLKKPQYSADGVTLDGKTIEEVVKLTCPVQVTSMFLRLLSSVEKIFLSGKMMIYAPIPANFFSVSVTVPTTFPLK